MILVLASSSRRIVDGAAMEGTFLWRLRFRPHPASAVAAAMVFLLALAQMADLREFVYSQF
ncbi:hypothetical protein [Teichococcus oryzae]|uniref:Uncharacterized protein n=1 Tax=Teichococcus oryzae TaxID=1608942 RepID=A0A5B2TC64_9PROT|nr:hypothetical protein [Pseudoroseomonas oryzae]KAA2211759.1 hypothetical protein F0Q34_18485 [Pseudoroseomonas oryzae]